MPRIRTYEPTYQLIKQKGEVTLDLGLTATDKDICGIMRGISQEKNNDPDKEYWKKMKKLVYLDEKTKHTMLCITHHTVQKQNINLY